METTKLNTNEEQKTLSFNVRFNAHELQQLIDLDRYRYDPQTLLTRLFKHDYMAQHMRLEYPHMASIIVAIEREPAQTESVQSEVLTSDTTYLATLDITAEEVDLDEATE